MSNVKVGDPFLEIRHLTKEFLVEDGRILRACDDVSLTAHKGQTLGIVGESGCGKSTLMRTITQIHAATNGEVLFHGEDILKNKGEKARQNRKYIQMVFQDPTAAFNPKMRIKDIICEPLLNFGIISKSEVDSKAMELLEMVELPTEFKDRYPHNMSGGQRQRVGIARALALEPEIIICDEATSALDVSVQRTICELLVRLQKEKGITYLFICHDLALVSLISHKVAVMYLGNVVEIMPAESMHDDCRHPYTQALMKAVFNVDVKAEAKIEVLEGELPSPMDIPAGCPFQTRCVYCMDICRQEKPILKMIDDRHQVACHLVK